MFIQPCQCKVQDLPSNVIEENIQVSHGLLEVIPERLAFVVDRFVDAELVLKPSALLRRASNCNDFRALDFADLADDGPSSASSS